MKLLLVGAESQVGSATVALLAERAIAYDILTPEAALNADIPALAKQLREQHLQFIVNVDHIDGFFVEGFTQRELEQRHVLIPQQLAKLAEALEIPLLQLSDYQVFSGMHDKPYREDDEPHGQTLYGVTRWQGELSVQRFTHRFIILRVGTIFSLQGRNVLTVLLGQWKQGKARELSTTLQFSPTPVSDVARVIFAILQQLECEVAVWGIYHYNSADIASPFDFAEVLLAARTQYHGLDNEIKLKPVQGALPKIRHKSRVSAPVPVNTVMSCEKILNTFGIRQRPWRGELTRLIQSEAKTVAE